MSVRYKIGLAMLTCAAVGALGDEAVRGQVTPPAYLIGQIDVSDPDGYAKEYLPTAREIIKAHGGRLLAAAGAGASGSARGTTGALLRCRDASGGGAITVAGKLGRVSLE